MWFRQTEYLGAYTDINNFLFSYVCGFGKALGGTAVATFSCVWHFLIAGAAGTKNGHPKDVLSIERAAGAQKNNFYRGGDLAARERSETSQERLLRACGTVRYTSRTHLAYKKFTGL